MEGFIQTTYAANAFQQNMNRNNSMTQTARVVPHFPPTNKSFNCTDFNSPDGIYVLLHETFYETIAPQYTIGTRASIASTKENIQATHIESSEDEGLYFGSSGNSSSNTSGTFGFGTGAFTMTPVKSSALPIPKTSSSSSINSNGLHILTSFQKLSTGSNTNSYFPPSPITPTKSNSTSHSQFNSESYLANNELGIINQTQQQQIDSSLSASFTNSVSSTMQNTSGNGSSFSSLFNKGMHSINTYGSKSTSLLPTPITRTMSNSLHSYNKPKNTLSKTNSSFIQRFIVHENLQKLLSDADEFTFFNSGSSFLWVDSNSQSKEPLSRIIFSRTYPVCHDINEATKSEDHLDIIIGFSTGDIFWYEPKSGKYSRLNKGGSMVSCAVTMIKWIPGSDDLFIAVFKNGTVLIMHKEREDQSFTIPEATSWIETEFQALKPHKNIKYNPVSCWKISNKGLTDLCFSPDNIHLAITGMDGKLRIIDYRKERLTDVFLSYFGKFNCVDWSPDGKYILTGGDDDLVTLWSFMEKRIIARCQGHNSWVTGVSFDRWKCDEENYRFGSVGEDCNLIFWDFSFGALQKPKHASRLSTILSPNMANFSIQPKPTIKTTELPLSPEPMPSVPPINIERKKSLKTPKLLRGLTFPDTNLMKSLENTNSSFGNRFRRRTSIKTNNLPIQHEQVFDTPIKQHLPVFHPPLKKNQAAMLQPTIKKEIHADPCLSISFRENAVITTDRRGRICTWGRP